MLEWCFLNCDCKIAEDKKESFLGYIQVYKRVCVCVSVCISLWQCTEVPTHTYIFYCLDPNAVPLLLLGNVPNEKDRLAYGKGFYQ